MTQTPNALSALCGGGGCDFSADCKGAISGVPTAIVEGETLPRGACK